VWPVRAFKERPSSTVVLLAIGSVLCFVARSVSWWTLRFVGGAADVEALSVGIGGTWLGPLLLLGGLALVASAVVVAVFVVPPRYERWIAQGAMALGFLLAFAALLSVLLPDRVIRVSERVATTSPHLGAALTLAAGVVAAVAGVRIVRERRDEAEA
jgi:hypothetical protein